MKSLWKKFDERMGHRTYGFQIDILGLPKKWAQMWSYRRKKKKELDAKIKAAKRADAEFARWFVKTAENRKMSKKETVERLKKELKKRKEGKQ